jgi:hypothetical protein
MAKETPLQTVKRIYGSKEKLVDSLVDVAKSAGEEAAEVKSRLLSASNKKLLRLAEVSAQVKERYGSRDKLAESVADALGRAKDSDYVAKLKSFSSGRLLDLAKSAERRARRAS